MYHFTDQNQHTTYHKIGKIKVATRYSTVIAPALCTPTSTANRFVMISSTAPIPAGVGITAAVITDSDVMERESSNEISLLPNRIRNGTQYQKHNFAIFFSTMEISRWHVLQ